MFIYASETQTLLSAASIGHYARGKIPCKNCRWTAQRTAVHPLGIVISYSNCLRRMICFSFIHEGPSATPNEPIGYNYVMTSKHITLFVQLFAGVLCTVRSCSADTSDPSLTFTRQQCVGAQQRSELISHVSDRFMYRP